MELKKTDKLIRLKHTYKKESCRELVRQLIINTILNYDAKKKTCYFTDLVKEINSHKFFKGTAPLGLVKSLIREELSKMAGSITFVKEHTGSKNNLMIVPTTQFYSSLQSMTMPNYTHERATSFTEHYLSVEE